MKRSTLSAVLVALAAWFAAPALAEGDDAARAAPTDRQLSQDAAPNDGELSNFVAAFLRLVGVQHGYMMMMRDEEDPTKLEAIKRNAIDDMTAAVEQDGMTVDRYNEIAVAVRDDPTLQGRVEEILQQLASEPSGEQTAPEEE